jgi:hypothetical protein
MGLGGGQLDDGEQGGGEQDGGHKVLVHKVQVHMVQDDDKEQQGCKGQALDDMLVWASSRMLVARVYIRMGLGDEQRQH